MTDEPEFHADLHCHTIYSDGSFSPKNLLLLARERNLSALAITDHDTIDAYAQAAPLAKELGIILGTGIEFASSWNRENIHILGYHFSLDSEELRSFCLCQQERRRARNHAILRKLATQRIILSEEEVRQQAPFSSSLGRPHIAQAMVNKGFVTTIHEAFYRYIGDGKPCFVSGEENPIPEILDVIHGAGGKGFIAHPHSFKRERGIEELLHFPFDGIECYYSTFSLQQVEKWLRIARRRNLLISGGSDFHGAFKPHIELGCSWVSQEMFKNIFS